MSEQKDSTSPYDRTEMPDPRAYPSFWENADGADLFGPDVLVGLEADAAEILSRYPQKRSALLPLLHLVQSVDGYVSGRGIEWCARKLDLTTAEVSGVATFYTQYKRHPNGDYTIGVCTNTLCAIMGGDQIFDELSAHLGVGHDETTPDGKITLERVECNAACDFAPVVMANWEFFDNQTPETAKRLADDLRSGAEVRPTRGADRVCGFTHISRVLAGFPDGRADEGVGAGGPSLEGLRVAHEHHWTAPGEDDGADRQQVARDTSADEGTTPKRGRPGSDDTPANPADSKPGDGKGQA
ncbi:MAG TPA: NADH-quinone oxidoreductase subunit NuoE [Segeticoccus sp.]|nr:NADH-quinone oxidoreductase subunit NuoE [Segeticoccus sp.]